MSELDAYDFELPRELVAQMPLRNRSDSRLLVVDRRRQSLELSHARDLGQWLDPGDLLVLNDTRVIPARLVGRREATGGRWTGLFLQAEQDALWQVMCKTRGRLKAGDRIWLHDRQSRPALALTLVAPLGEGLWAARPESDLPPLTLLEQVGRVPLPPYIRGGEMVDNDLQTYQTVFAQHPGSVAAPTAGLHFTEELLKQLQSQGLQLARVTLHVGLGTFRPIKSERLDDHQMHREWAQVSAETQRQLHACRQRRNRVVAVGTTVVRTLETVASLNDSQAPWQGETDLFIRPPYEFRGIDALLTNFHLPKSTLLILARTFGGDALVRRAYELAIEERLRFFSYGDAMLIL